MPSSSSSSSTADTNPDTTSTPDAWAWWRRDTGSGEYTGIEAGLATIADCIRDAGGIDGVIGFSQGAAASAMVAALLEEGRVEAFNTAAEKKGGMPYPTSFLVGSDEQQRQINTPLKFAVCYSGFYAPNSLYSAFYDPKLTTPTLHFIGSLDSVVDESRCLTLAGACQAAKVVYHPGGHFVPIGKEMAGALIGFIREACADEKEVDESVEDMDMPF